MVLTVKSRRSAWCWAMLSMLAVVPVFGLFSVQDDILALPQFQISMSNDVISEDDAARLLSGQAALVASSNDKDVEHYETLRLHGEKFLCSLPVLEPQAVLNASEKELSKSEEEKELTRAQASGWDLLEPLNGTCLYYMAGWWTYSFCHKVEVKQFHQLAPQKGVTLYPPKEDPSESYVLGRVARQKISEESGEEEGDSAQSSLGEEKTVQSAGEMRYLVQKIGGGSICDLTGRERKIEIQFHCNQHSQDKIAWIKEVTTCRYLMVIHTPRLCQDVAFLPPKEDRANEINCQRIMSEEDMEKSRATASFDAEVLAAMIDHDIDGARESASKYKMIGGKRYKVKRSQSEHMSADRNIAEQSDMSVAAESDTLTPSLNDAKGSSSIDEAGLTHSTNADYSAQTHVDDPDVEMDNVFRGGRFAAKDGPDLVTSAKMLIRDIESQMAAGTFLTPEGKVASADDEFSYSVALVDVNGQVIGVVTVVVSKGKVRVELDQSHSARGLEDRKGLLDKYPDKLKDELREFSGGAMLDEIANSLDSSRSASSSRTNLWQDEDGDEVDENDATDDNEEQQEDAEHFRIVIRDEL
ncbi:glucosidase II beta subunit-like protein-domain-containing protein [Lipomyces chichibuensis]|uniref:glucosidase II beta subunit-like protein-domain-containing protein n=1 Tax=Lipomyces chichibuensis TaxID=1546026 RepID=UPI00334369AE